MRGRHGIMMVVELGHWAGRWNYFRGSFYQDDIVFLFENLLREGDVFVNAGANRGMITSLAGRLIGPTGTLYAFEPNPHLIGLIENHVALNRLTNVRIFNCGLSDTDGPSMIVATPSPSMGWVALGGLPEGEEGHAIRLVRGDDVLAELAPSRPTILKMDVEGHEVHALRGLGRFLERRELAVVCEVSHQNLSRAGSTADEMFRLMKDHGFDAFEFDVVQSRWRRSLRLSPLDGPLADDVYDALFIRPGTALWHRLDAAGSRARAGAAQGRASLADFRVLCGLVARLERGVWLNIGSAVVMPEVFLKTVAIARNLGCSLDGMTTANLDFQQQYRGRLNVLDRPGGAGIALTGHHELLIPLLHAAVVARLPR